MGTESPAYMPPPNIKKYVIVPTSVLSSIDYSLLEDDSIETTLVSVDTLSAVIEYKEAVADGMTEEEIIAYLEENYWDWNIDTVPTIEENL